MKRSDAVRHAGEVLISAETAIDQAFEATARLAAELSRLRLQTQTSAVVGQEAFDELTEALTHIGRGRAAMVRAHGRLDDVRTRIGCRHVAAGGQGKYPDGPEVANITSEQLGLEAA